MLTSHTTLLPAQGPPPARERLTTRTILLPALGTGSMGSIGPILVLPPALWVVRVVWVVGPIPAPARATMNFKKFFHSRSF